MSFPLTKENIRMVGALTLTIGFICGLASGLVLGRYARDVRHEKVEKTPTVEARAVPVEFGDLGQVAYRVEVRDGATSEWIVFGSRLLFRRSAESALEELRMGAPR